VNLPQGLHTSRKPFLLLRRGNTGWTSYSFLRAANAGFRILKVCTLHISQTVELSATYWLLALHAVLALSGLELPPQRTGSLFGGCADEHLSRIQSLRLEREAQGLGLRFVADGTGASGGIHVPLCNKKKDWRGALCPKCGRKTSPPPTHRIPRAKWTFFDR
jgi:hypothetical protein